MNRIEHIICILLLLTTLVGCSTGGSSNVSLAEYQLMEKLSEWDQSFNKELNLVIMNAGLMTIPAYEEVLAPLKQYEPEFYKKTVSKFPVENNRYVIFAMWTNKPLPKDMNKWNFALGKVMYPMNASKDKSRKPGNKDAKVVELFDSMFDFYLPPQANPNGVHIYHYVLKLKEPFNDMITIDSIDNKDIKGSFNYLELQVIHGDRENQMTHFRLNNMKDKKE